MYEAIDLLHPNINEIEKTVFFNTANLFNLEVDLIFYDTTTASFHVDTEDDSETDTNATLCKFGHGKEGGWAPQVVAALAVTRKGVPVRSWVSGNTANVSTVTRVRADLRGWNLGRAMIVADSGMNSEDNRAELTKACGKYLLACRMASVSEVKREVLGKRGRYTKFRSISMPRRLSSAMAKDADVPSSVTTPREAERQGHHRQMIIELLESELARRKDHSATAQWALSCLPRDASSAICG